MITGFHHTGITVRNIDRMVAFYTQDIGLKLQHEVDSTAPPEGDHTGVPGARRKLIFVGVGRISLQRYHIGSLQRGLHRRKRPRGVI